MKKILFFFAGCVIVGLILSSIFSLLPVLPYIGKGFLTTIEQRKYQQAYIVMSVDFKQRVDLPHFIHMAQQSVMAQYKEVNWLKTVLDKNTKSGYIVGVMTTKQNTKIMVQIDFVQEKSENWQDQGWRIKELHFQESDKK